MQSVRKKQKEMSKQASGFSMLNIEEVLDCLSALGISASYEDFTKPTLASTQNIWAGLLESLMGMPTDALEDPRHQILDAMGTEHKELYDTGLKLTMFYRLCYKLAVISGIKDFNFTDVTRPDGQRFRYVMSGVMNFAKFRDDRVLEFFRAQSAKLHKVFDQVYELRVKIEETDAEIAAIHAKEEEDAPRIAAKKAENEVLREHLQQLSQDQQQLSVEVEKLKAERSQLAEQIRQGGVEAKVIRDQIVSAASRLVKSPDRVKREISHLNSEVSRWRGDLAAVQNKGRDYSARLELIAWLETEVGRLIELCRDVAEQRGFADQARRDIATWNDKIEQLRQEKSSLEQKTHHLDRQYQLAQERLERQEAMRKDAIVKGQARLGALQKRNNDVNDELERSKKELHALADETKQVEDEMRAYLSEREVEINDLLREYWTIRKHMEDYMNVMTSTLQLQIPA